MSNRPFAKPFWYLRILRVWSLTYLSSLIARLRLVVRGAQVGAGFEVCGWLNLAIHPTSFVSLGDHVRINSGFSRNAVGAYQKFGLYVGAEGHLVVGDRVGISNSTIVCKERIEIESDVLIGGGCAIYDTDFHILDYRLRRLQRRDAQASSAPIIIGKGSFIGGHSVILKGVRIGEGAVVGAGSLVTRDIPAYEIWGGNPVHYLRSIASDAHTGNEHL